MKNRFAVVVAVFACTALVLVMASQMLAQEKKPIEYSGRVTSINKDTKTITLQVKTSVIHVKYNDKTQYTFRNQPGKIDDVKEGLRVIVLADPAQPKEIVALRIDVREK